jgi:16S rRNA (guanine527-N7)-methyltransferase
MAPNLDLTTDRARALALTPVSRETEERLAVFVECLLQRQQTLNLVADSTIPHIWTRHIADSLQLLSLAPGARIWADLGSGGGFPGLPLACALAEREGAEVHLVESTRKKCGFLNEAIRATAAPAVVHCERIADFARTFRGTLDVVTARALAPLPILLDYVRPFVKTGAKALLLKGQDVDAELTEASKYWIVQAELVASKTSASSKIAVIRSVEPRKRKG